MHRRRILVPQLVLSCIIEERELPRVHADYAGHPSRRGRDARQFDHRVDKVDQRNLAAAPAGRLKRTHETTVEQNLPALIAEPPQFAIPGGRFCKLRREPFGLGE